MAKRKTDSMAAAGQSAREAEYRETLWAMLPDGGLENVEGAEHCLFCNDGHFARPEWYAVSDLGHLLNGEQAGPGGVEAGGQRAGLVTLHIPCCEKCRRNIRKAKLISVCFSAAGLALGLLASLVQSWRYAMMRIHAAAPALIFLLLGLLGWQLGRIFQRRFVKKKDVVTEFDIRRIPEVRAVVEKGWFSIEKDGRAPRLVFSREKLKNGLFR